MEVEHESTKVSGNRRTYFNIKFYSFVLIAEIHRNLLARIEHFLQETFSMSLNRRLCTGFTYK